MSQQKKNRGPRAQAVYDLETGRVFDSINMCARAVKISPHIVSVRLKKNDSRFRYVNKKELQK